MREINRWIELERGRQIDRHTDRQTERESKGDDVCETDDKD